MSTTRTCEVNGIARKSVFRRLSSPIMVMLILLFLPTVFTTNAYGQASQITGKVTDKDGVAIIGAIIANTTTQNGTATDNNGHFSIKASKGDSLRISGVGYKEQTVAVTDASSLTLNLESTTKLDEVTVVGYGTQRKEAVTGAVASISGDKLRDVPSANASQALQGRLAGIQISQTSTQPGATMQIRIRGVRSLTADNNPLIVLDGIPFAGSIADINPTDIKSMDILKDASATAIYGSRGANGVVLITTNKGQVGRDAKISYNAYVGAQTVFAKYPMMNGAEFVALRNARKQYTNGTDESDAVNTDWQDLLYKTGIVNSHDVGISGGTQTGSYNVGLGYYSNQGVVPSQRYTRYSLRTSLDQKVGKYFRVGFTTNNKYSISEGSQISTYNALAASPIANPYNADGSTKRIVNIGTGDAYVLTKDVVDQTTKDGTWVNQTRGYATYNSMFGEVNIPWITGLKYRVNLGLDFIQSNNGTYTGTGINSTNATTLSSAGITNSQTYHWTIENIISYDHSFGEKHHLNFIGLYSNEQNKYNSSNMSATGIPADAFQFYNLGQATGQITVSPANQSYSMWGLMSGMGRLMYSYDDRYMLSATLRSDASSRLAEGHKSHTYPAISAGWNIANESFMQSVTWVNSLKLRVGYGQTSNQAISPYSTLGSLSTRPYNFGASNYATGYYVSTLANTDLGWEYSATMNYAVDFSLIKNRLSGTIEYYKTNTKDLLLGVNLPASTGVTSYTANVGQTQNTGVELTLNATVINNPNGLTWDVGFNMYSNKNKITALASGQTKDEGNWWFVGSPINVIYDYKKTGLWQKDDPYLNILEPGGAVGMIKVEYTGTYNADGTPTRAIGPADRQIINTNPDFLGGFNTRVAYKGFDLTIVGMFQSGGIVVSTLYGSNGYLNTLTTRNNNVKVDYWTPEHTDAKYPNPAGPLSGDNPKYGSTLAYFDASYVKIRTITLGYDFNRSLLRNKNIKLRGYVTVQNPFVLFSPYHKESGMDPETNSYGDENAAVTSAYPNRILTIGTNAPATRNYVIGLNMTF